MNYEDAIEPVTVLKTRSAELIRKARESGQPIVITQNGKATAVLQDVESFQRQRDALRLLQFIVAGDQQVRAGEAIPHDEAKERIQAKLRALAGG